MDADDDDNDDIIGLTADDESLSPTGGAWKVTLPTGGPVRNTISKRLPAPNDGEELRNPSGPTVKVFLLFSLAID